MQERLHYAQRQRIRLATLRADWIAAHGPCAVCGSTERLEVDHIDPATKTVGSFWEWPDVRREAELSKCQVLCYVCHKAKTRRELVARAANARALNEVMIAENKEIAIRRIVEAASMPTRFMLPSEVASEFRVHVRTVRKWVEQGLLPAVQTPGGQLRIRHEDVERLLTTPVAPTTPVSPEG
jgi:excisionase family DNA binding protein